MTEQEWLTSTDPQAMLRVATGRQSLCCGCRWTDNGDGTVSLLPGETPCRRCDNDTPGEGYKPLVSERKLRLAACAIARLIDGFHPERDAVLVACENVADGEPTQWGKGNRGLINARKSIDAVWGWTWCATCENIASGLWRTIRAMRGNAGNFYRQEEVANLMREIFGNPWRSVAVKPDWLTPMVISIAIACYLERPGKVCSGGCKRYSDDDRVYYTWPVDHRGPQPCPTCHGSGRIEDGTLDPVRLSILADALEEVGCPSEVAETVEVVGGHRCPKCDGPAHWRRGGYHYENQKRCPKCNLSWEPGRESVCFERRLPHPILAHLRSPGPKYRGMWSLDLIRGAK